MQRGRPCPAPTTSATTSLRSSATARTRVRRSTPPAHRREKRWRSTRSRWTGTAAPSARKPTSAARPSAAMPSSRAIAPTSAESSPSPSRSCTSTVCVDGAAASRDMMRAASTAPPRSTSSTSSASGAEPCCSQMVPAKPGGRRASVAGRWMADGEPRAQAELRTFGDAHDVAAGPQRVEDAPLADPFQMLGRPGAAQDGQPAQFVGLLVGRRIGQHMGLVVLDADHPVGALGDRLRQPEQVGAGVAARVAAVAVVLERVVDQFVEQLPPGARFDGDHGGAECRGQFHRGGRRLLDEDRGGHRPVRPAARSSRPPPRRTPRAGRTGRRSRRRRPGRAGCRRRRRARPTPPACPARAAPRPASPSCGPARAAAGRATVPRAPPSTTPLSDSTISRRRRCSIGHRLECAERGSLLHGCHHRGSEAGQRAGSRIRTGQSRTHAPRRPRSPNWPTTTRSTCRTSSAASTGWAAVNASTSSSRTATPPSWAPSPTPSTPTRPPPSTPRWPPRTAWADTPFDERAAVFLRAADLLAGPWREKLCRGNHARPVQDRPTRPRSTRPAS